MPSYPTLFIDTRKIAHNARLVSGMLAGQGMRLVGVAKAVMGHPAVAKAMIAGGASAIGDSRIENLRKLRESGYTGETLLLRAPSPSRIDETVRFADASLNSDAGTVRLLGEAASKLGKRHEVILMIDTGDLREGVMEEDAVRVAREMSKVPGVEFSGIGTNLACFGGVIPTRVKMESLLSVKKVIEDSLGIPIRRVSGGNSANMRVVMAGDVPPGITELRVGETVILGTEGVGREPVPGLHLDAITLVAEVIEVGKKPSVPFGQIGQDAFGAVPVFVDKGRRTRAILAAGRQDLDPDTLKPVESGIAVIGASSDHLLCDVEDAGRQLRPGDTVTFVTGYSALLRAVTSPFVEKVVR